eukprot:6212303-Pleurochrysis_carterae.AAC.2
MRTFDQTHMVCAIHRHLHSAFGSSLSRTCQAPQLSESKRRTACYGDVESAWISSAPSKLPLTIRKNSHLKIARIRPPHKSTSFALCLH